MANLFFSHHGNVRYDHLGRIVIDPCSSDEAHLNLPDPPPEGQDRHRCRKLLESVFDQLVGKKGTIVITVEFQED